MTLGDLDDVLLRALLAHWEDYFATGNDTIKNRRLFRALEMARAASRMPGGTDATFFDEGRAVALWVSAFEILAHDGHHSDFGRVLSLLSQVVWQSPTLKAQDHQVSHKGTPIPTNLAGAIYKRLHWARTSFLHGDKVTAETLRREKSEKRVLWFVAPLFRLALTAFLDLRFSETRSKFVGSMTTSQIVMPRDRVSMNITTLATSPASSRLPASLASFSFSGGQSASSALMTGPGEIEPTRMPCLNTWRRTVWTKQLIAHLDDAYSHWRT